MRALSVLLLLLLASCYRVVESGEETSIVFDKTVHVFAVAFPLLALYGAIRFWSRPRGRAYAVVCAVFAFGFSLATWSVFASRIVMTSTEIYDWRGFPWERTKRGFRFADVARVSTSVERSGYGRSSRSQRVWHLQLRNGGSARIEPGDLWEHAQREIFERLERHGIELGIDRKDLGLPSADPFVVTVDQAEYRLDSASAKERLAGLVFGGHIGKLIAEEGSGDLTSAGREGRSLIGLWKRRIGQGSRTLEMRLRFEASNEFAYEVEVNGKSQRSRGTFRAKDGSLQLDQDGGSFSVLF